MLSPNGKIRPSTKKITARLSWQLEGIQHMTELKKFYTVKELAEMLQVTDMTIYRLVRRGKLPCYNIGRAKRFRRDDVETFLEDCRTRGKDETIRTAPSIDCDAGSGRERME